ncbi:phosphate ABC transporter, permease protein PstA [Methanohalophilus halophilus]|nr:phosphate ABC transporter, permease protein PstA [Methanohalophilus halophilus]RNI09184.1 phosphate ABC transporter permease PstA [Methanohalophilus halophilus]
MNRRGLKDYFFAGISYLAITITLLCLIGILSKIAMAGIPYITPEFLLTSEAGFDGFGGAIGNAIIGSIYLSLGSTLLATPLAVGTAIYLQRYAKDGYLVKIFRFFIDVLSGTPSIVLGLFAFLFLVFYMRTVTGGFSMLSGIIALAILVLPVIERATEEAIMNVPGEIEDASYALGATKWQTIRDITIPYAMAGILTGVVLSVGRAAEESAVVILSAGYSQFYPEYKVASDSRLLFDLKLYPFQDSIAALPITVYHGFEFPHMVDPGESFAAAFVLIAIVMIINLIARLIVWKRKMG